MEEKYFQVKNLTFSYDNKNKILYDISFGVDKNEKVLILASTDMGATTFLSVLSTFQLKYDGDIFLSGKNLNEIQDNEKNFSFLTTIPILLKNKTVMDNILFLKKHLKSLKAETELNEIFSNENLDQILKNYGLFDLKNTKVKKLSLLNQRKLAILRSKLKKPSILFLDNQFQNLTDDESKEMLDIYKNITKNEEKTTFIALNNIDFLKFCEELKKFNFSKILYLVDSEIIEFKSILDFQNKQINLNHFLFFENYLFYDGCITKEDGKYYFLNEEYEYFELDSEFNSILNKLNLTLCQFEDVTLVYKTEIDFITISPEKLIELIKSKEIKVFSKIDRELLI